MKYSNLIGAVAAISLSIFCFLPWVYIGVIQTTLTGFFTEHTNFGRPGIVHIVFAALTFLFFLLNKIWAKRINVFICTLNVAWAFRNFILMSRCELGDCPERRTGIYAIVIFSVIMMVMSLLPKMRLKD